MHVKETRLTENVANEVSLYAAHQLPLINERVSCKYEVALLKNAKDPTYWPCMHKSCMCMCMCIDPHQNSNH